MKIKGLKKQWDKKKEKGKIQSAFYESLPVILPVLNLKFHSRRFYTAVICPPARGMDGRVTYCLMAFLRSFSKFNSVCSLSAAVVSAILARGRFYCGPGPL